MTEPLATGFGVIPDGEMQQLLNIAHTIHEGMLATLDYDEYERHERDAGDLGVFLVDQIEKYIAAHPAEVNEARHDILVQMVLDEIRGFGPIEPLLRDDSVTDIFVNGPNEIFVERKGKIESTPFHFRTHEHVYGLIQRVASQTGRHLDLAMPYFDGQMPDGSRVHAIIPPLAPDGTKISIRKFQHDRFNLDALIDVGAMTAEMAQFLAIAVQARLNIVISGGTGSGKTTLMNAMLGFVGDAERLITIEDVAELSPQHGHIVRLVTRLPNVEGKGEVSQDTLVINALRMRPDRIIIGEARGPEAFNMLHAMNTGQDGSLMTLHANGTAEVMPRLTNLILMARYNIALDSIRQQVANAVDVVVHVGRLIDGSRKVTGISQMWIDEQGEVHVDDLFRFDITNPDPEGVVGEHRKSNPTPRFWHKLGTYGQSKAYTELFNRSEWREGDLL